MKRVTYVVAMFAVVFASMSFSSEPNVGSQKQTQTVYIVHGYAATPKDHWFSWLEQNLKAESVDVKIIKFPSPQKPVIGDWVEALKNQTDSVNEHSYFVAHSLGSISLLRYLEESAQSKKIGGYILVSGFNEFLPNLPQLDEFIRSNINYSFLAGLTDHRVVISARDDSIVPFKFSRALSDRLNAKFISFDQGGHFLASDGFSTFPQVLAEIKSQLSHAHVGAR